MTTHFSVIRVSLTEFRLRGELDMATAPTFYQEVIARMSRHGRVTLDLSGLTFMDSTGLKAINDAANALEFGSIRLVGAQRAVQLVIDLAGLARTPCIESVAQAS